MLCAECLIKAREMGREASLEATREAITVEDGWALCLDCWSGRQLLKGVNRALEQTWNFPPLERSTMRVEIAHDEFVGGDAPIQVRRTIEYRLNHGWELEANLTWKHPESGVEVLHLFFSQRRSS